MSLVLRPAIPEDAAVAACLLAETSGDFGVQVLGLGDPELQLKALQTWFIERGNRFSYQFSQTAEKYGMPVGILLAFEGAKLLQLEWACSRSLFSIYGFRNGLRMIRLNSALVNAKEAEKDEYLIAHLAVDENFRRQGIARALLVKAEEDARSAGYQKLVLEVEMTNDKARSLYQQFGFETVAKVYYNPRVRRFDCPGYFKMSKQI